MASQVFCGYNDPAFKRRRFSFLIEVTDLFYCTQVIDSTPSASALKRLLGVQLF